MRGFWRSEKRLLLIGKIRSAKDQLFRLRDEEEERRGGDGHQRFGEHERAVIQEGIEFGAVEEGLTEHDEFIVVDPQQDAREVVHEEAQEAGEDHSDEATDRALFAEQSRKTQNREREQIVQEHGSHEHSGRQTPCDHIGQSRKELEQRIDKRGGKSPFQPVAYRNQHDGEHGEECDRAAER